MGMTPLPDVARAARHARAARLALTAATGLGTCVLLAACGSVAAPNSGGVGSSSAGSTPAESTPSGSTQAGSTQAGANSAMPNSPATAANAKVSIAVTFAAIAATPARHYTLTCEPAGGTTPDPAVACAKLLTGDNIFAPRPLKLLCPMVMEGSGRATITGTYFGREVHMVIVNGGCDLASWAKLKAIFG
jgi:Subtilisin inhibitor-like